MSSLQVANIHFESTANNRFQYVGSNTVTFSTAGTERIRIDNTGNTTFANTINVTGAATFSNTISVTGNVTFSNTVSIQSDLSVTGNSNFKNYTEGVVNIGTVTTSSTINLTNGTVQTATLTASTGCTFTMPTAAAGKSFILLLKQAASTGSGTATFTGVKWGTAGAPTITATAGKMDIVSFVSDGTNWYGTISQGYTP